MAGLQIIICSVCHRHMGITGAVCQREQVASQGEIRVCSKLCEDHFRYWAGVAHGMMLLEVLQRLCGNLTCLNSNTSRPLPYSSEGSFFQSKGPPFETLVKREVQVVPHPDEDVTDVNKNLQVVPHSDEGITDVKVFFDEKTDIDKPVYKPKPAAASPQVCAGQHYGEKEESRSSLQEETHVQNSSENGPGFVKSSHKAEMFKCDKCCRRFSTIAHLEDHIDSIACDAGQENDHCSDGKAASKGKGHMDLGATGKYKRNKRLSQVQPCTKDFSVKTGLRHHVQSTHPKPTNKDYVICDVSSKTETQLKQHRLRKQTDTDYCNGQEIKKNISGGKCSKKEVSSSTPRQWSQLLHSRQLPSDCKICGKSYITPRVAREHMRTVHRVRVTNVDGGEILLQCTFCSETFTEFTKERIVGHLRQAHVTEMAPSHTCNLCGHKFKRKFTLNYHLRNTHCIVNGSTKNKVPKEKMHPCEKCGKTLSKHSLRRHMLMFHSKHVPSECKVCGKNMQSALHLECHMRCHSSRPARMCHICGVNFKSDQGLASHLAAHKGVRSHVCEFCGAGFVRRTSWQRHIRQHSDSVFQCDICSKDFSTDYTLHSHMLSKHQRGGYFSNRLKTLQDLGYTPDMQAVERHLNNQCVICSQALVDATCPQHPDTHMLVFSCNKCNMNFKHIEVLCHHLKNHEDREGMTPEASATCGRNYTLSSLTTKRGKDILAYSCNVCHKSFQRREYVSHHMKQHREKSFACPVCNKTFTYKCNMKNHLLTHSAEKPFRCDICQKGFKRQSLLKCHTRVHDPSRSPFRCQICGKGLTRKQYLQQHYKLVHPELQEIPLTI